jgi:hypothetical protein
MVKISVISIFQTVIATIISSASFADCSPVSFVEKLFRAPVQTSQIVEPSLKSHLGFTAFDLNGKAHKLSTLDVKKAFEKFELSQKNVAEANRRFTNTLGAYLKKNRSRSEHIELAKAFSMYSPLEYRRWAERLTQQGFNRNFSSRELPSIEDYLYLFKTRLKKEQPFIPIYLNSFGLKESDFQTMSQALDGFTTRPPTHISQLERTFDVIHRKSAPLKGFVHEIENAAATRGIADYKIKVLANGELSVEENTIAEKVFALHSEDATYYPGILSNKPDARLYGVVYPKNFIDQYSLKTHTLDIDASRISSRAESEGGIFARKNETRRKQVHFYLKLRNLSWKNCFGTLSYFLRQNALGLVEYTPSGSVKRFYRFPIGKCNAITVQ